MIVRHYEQAKALARDLSDDALNGRMKRYDRIGTRLALIGLASFAAFFCGDWLLRVTGIAGNAHAGPFRVFTILLPGIGIAAFMIGSDMLRERRGIVELARRIRAENAAKEDSSCRPG
ncbi:MAG TPA: hypothetical protein VLC10_00340 [Patescibacteria group bacterium]|nr:hypothetical protein [Patescibacteria group bacterium]